MNTSVVKSARRLCRDYIRFVAMISICQPPVTSRIKIIEASNLSVATARQRHIPPSFA
jgi:hypothetical protein